MFGLGTMELAILLVLGLLLFGHKLPGLARSLGRAIVDFRQETAGLTDEMTGAKKSIG